MSHGIFYMIERPKGPKNLKRRRKITCSYLYQKLMPLQFCITVYTLALIVKK